MLSLREQPKQKPVLVDLPPSFTPCEWRSPEWETASTACTFRASNVGACLGVSKNTSRIKAWEGIRNRHLPQNKTSQLQTILDWGSVNEAKAARDLELYAERWQDLYSDENLALMQDKFQSFTRTTGVFKHAFYDVSCTPDALAWPLQFKDQPFVNGSDLVKVTAGVEIKCPWSLKLPDTVPAEHMCQIQTMAEILKVETWLYFVWTPEVNKMFLVKRSQDAWNRLIWPRLETFATCYLNGNVKPPPLFKKEKNHVIATLNSYCQESQRELELSFVHMDDFVDFFSHQNNNK